MLSSGSVSDLSPTVVPVPPTAPSISGAPSMRFSSAAWARGGLAGVVVVVDEEAAPPPSLLLQPAASIPMTATVTAVVCLRMD